MYCDTCTYGAPTVAVYYVRAHIRTKYVGTYGGTLVAAVTLGLQVDCPHEPCPLALLENVVVLALKRVPALLVEVTRSGRVWGGSCPGCSEEKTSNVVRVPITLQEQGRTGECSKSSCQPSLGLLPRTTRTYTCTIRTLRSYPAVHV